MKVLIIGSQGFIGSHLTKYLQARSDVFTADISDSESRNHSLLPVSNPDFQRLLKAIAPDICINCAGAANVGHSFTHPTDDFLLNVQLVQALLEAIRSQSPNSKFLNLSSAAVYGNPCEIPVKEDATCGPISPYGWHKFAAEMLCREFHACYGLQTISLRPFSVYGPGLRKQLFWDIFQKSLTSDKIICPGTGNETRDFIYVEDMAQATWLCCTKAIFDGRSINVANGIGTTITDAVHRLLSELEWSGEIAFNGIIRDGDPLYWTADVSQLDEIGYHPIYQFQHGIVELARWLKNLR
jgi:dTDP-glucose 4,6-dehydratase/UDP-glucose 4-epimerase